MHVGLNSEFGEIIWFYPKDLVFKLILYVVYNYTEKVWYYGTLARDAWLDRGIKLTLGHWIIFTYNHETGNDDDGSAMTSRLHQWIWVMAINLRLLDQLP